MAKKELKLHSVVAPTETVVVSAYDPAGKADACTLAFYMVSSHVPPCVTIAINATQKRKTLKDMLETKAFVLGFPSISQVKEADYLGVESGYNTDKLANIGFTTSPAQTVHAPVINELPLSLECEIVHTVTVGSHTQVTGEVKRILVDESVLNEKGRVVLEKLQPIIYNEEEMCYHALGEKVADAFRTGAALMKSLEKLTIVIPQWQGGGQDLCTYEGAFAYRENYLAGAAGTTVEISTADISPVREGILGYDDILESMQQVNQELQKQEPSRIFTVGGGCDADTPCAAWLNKVYDGDMAVVYIDSHGDLNTPESSESHLYYGMSLRALAGESAPEFLEHLTSTITPAQLITCGARNLDPDELQYKAEHQVTDFTVVDLEADPGLVAAAIKEKEYQNVYIHIDLDVLDPAEFSLTPLAEPDGMTKDTLLKVMQEIKAAANVVGFGLLEYSGTMEDRDDPFLEALAKFGMEL